ncbi:MAG: thiol-disulfide oxidoreductase DCC family protein [Myxococcota bacterium]
MPSEDAVLIFDGRCGFCTRSVEWLKPRVREAVRFEPYQVLDLSLHGLTREEASRHAWWVEPDRRRYRGHLAVGRALMACGGGWAWIGRLLLVPPVRWLAAIGYALVARNRRHLPGAVPACERDHWDSRPISRS